MAAVTALAPLSIIGIVVAFMIGILGSFPFTGGDAGATPGAGAVDETYSVESVRQAGSLFNAGYRSVIDEMISFQRNPDYQRAEGDRQKMLTYANNLLPKFEGLTNRLQGEFDQVTGGAQP